MSSIAFNKALLINKIYPKYLNIILCDYRVCTVMTESSCLFSYVLVRSELEILIVCLFSKIGDTLREVEYTSVLLFYNYKITSELKNVFISYSLKIIFDEKHNFIIDSCMVFWHLYKNI